MKTIPKKNSRPNLELAVPRACAKRHSIRADLEARHTVSVTLKGHDTITLQSIPDVAVVIIITCKEEATAE